MDDPIQKHVSPDGRSGIRVTNDGRFEVWHRLLQFLAVCETELDARTVLRALRSTSEEPDPEPRKD